VLTASRWGAAAGPPGSAAFGASEPTGDPEGAALGQLRCGDGDPPLGARRGPLRETWRAEASCSSRGSLNCAAWGAVLGN
jgi:hypothetical protein